MKDREKKKQTTDHPCFEIKANIQGVGILKHRLLNPTETHKHLQEDCYSHFDNHIEDVIVLTMCGNRTVLICFVSPDSVSSILGHSSNTIRSLVARNFQSLIADSAFSRNQVRFSGPFLQVLYFRFLNTISIYFYFYANHTTVSFCTYSLR